MTKTDIYSYIEKNQDLFISVSHRIWELAELSLMEKKSAELYCKVLEEQGFQVEKGLSNMETAFWGKYGEGRPYIGILGEFDALSGLSQEAGKTYYSPVVPGGNGHGCGHNMLGAGSLAAACAVKQYLMENNLSGTVIYYGCPGEEGYASKTYMAQDNVWRGLDVAITWHPSTMNRVTTGSCIASIQREYTFSGIAAHAAGNPECGRSALDAIQLMNMGVEFMREHVPDSTRIHYAITDAGGVSPNVVQAQAKVVYMVRCPQIGDTRKLAARVDKIAKAAADMTETQVEVCEIDSTANTVNNTPFERLAYENMVQVGIPTYTEEELQYAMELIRSYEAPVVVSEIEDLEDELDQKDYDMVCQSSNNGRAAINNFVVPYKPCRKVRMGSTDVGDVSWQTPTVQVETATFPANCPGHSWQNVSCSATSIGDKGMILAAKVMAGTAVDLLHSQELLDQIRAEFAKRTKESADSCANSICAF